MTRIETLSNGLRVVLDASPHAPVVAIQAWVEVGSADEVGREAGLAHVHEHMLFKGTASRQVGEITRDVESAGGAIGAFTSFDHTVFHLNLPSRSVDAGIAIIADVLQNAAFDAGELEREKQVILEELLQSQNNPVRCVSQALFDTAYQTHPYRLPVIGTEASIQGTDQELVQGFFRKWYGADRVVLGIGGAVDEEAVLRRIEEEFGGMSVASGLRSRPTESAQTSSRCQTLSTPFQHTLLSVGFPIPAHTDADIPLLDLLGIIVGQGESCRLARAMKRESGVLLGGSASCFKGVDPGMFTLMGACNAERIEEALGICFSELAALRRGELDLEEFERAKTVVLSGRIYEQDAVEGIVGKRAFFSSIYRDPNAEARYFDAISEARLEDLVQVSERYLRVDAVNAAIALEEGGVFDGEIEELVSCLEPGSDGERASAPTRRAPLESATESVVVGASGNEGGVFWRLPGGGDVILQADAAVPMCGIQAIFPGGLRAESRPVSGVSELLAETLLQGTMSRSAEEIANIIERSAGHLSGFVRLNSFGIGGVCLKDALPDTLDVLFDVLRRASYPTDAVERERNLQLEGIRSQEDDPGGIALQVFRETLYGEHPYGFSLLGTEQSVSRLDGTNLREWHARHVRQSALTLSFCGDVDVQWLRDTLAQATEGWADTAEEIDVPAPDTAALFAPRACQVEREGKGEQTHLAIGFPGTTIDASDREGLMVLLSILGGQSGRLFHALRERQSLGYDVSFQGVEGIDPGYLVGYVATHPDKEAQALESFRAELARARETLPTEEEFDRVKSYIAGSYEMGLQSRLSRAAEAGFAHAYGIGWEHFRTFPERLAAVTRDDVLSLAQAYLDPEKEVLVTVRPFGH